MSSVIDLNAFTRYAVDLPPLPASATRLAKLLGNDDWSPQDVVKIVEKDPFLAGHILAVANSARYASRGSTKTIREAVVRLGLSTVVSRAMGLFVRSRLSSPSAGRSASSLWRESIGASLVIEAVPESGGAVPPPESATAALLHGIGKLALESLLAPHLLALIEEAELGGLDRVSAERQVIGVHYGDVGGLIAQAWQLPDSITQAIIGHPVPGDDDDAVCLATHVASVLARPRTQEPENPFEAIAPLASASMRLTPERCARVVQIVKDRLDEAAA